MGDFQTVFALSGLEAGWIGGAAIWGFTISFFALGPFVDLLGMKRLRWFAFACHMVGPVRLILAGLYYNIRRDQFRLDEGWMTWTG